MATFEVKFKLKRNIIDEDNTWYDTKHIKSEIITWLEDLDYSVHDIVVKEKKQEVTNGRI